MQLCRILHDEGTEWYFRSRNQIHNKWEAGLYCAKVFLPSTLGTVSILLFFVTIAYGIRRIRMMGTN
jgi:hypothetical protein